MIGLFLVDAAGIYALQVRSNDARPSGGEIERAPAEIARADVDIGPSRLPSPRLTSPQGSVRTSREVAETIANLRLAHAEPVTFAPITLVGDPEQDGGLANSSGLQPVRTVNERREVRSVLTAAMRGHQPEPSMRFSRAFGGFGTAGPDAVGASAYAGDAALLASGPGSATPETMPASSDYPAPTAAAEPTPSGELPAIGDNSGGGTDAAILRASGASSLEPGSGSQGTIEKSS